MSIIWDDMSQKVLSKKQLKLKPILEEFAISHILVGGTAIALQLGHRTSIDFDLFCFEQQGTGKELAIRIENTGLKRNPERSNFLWLSEDEQADITIYMEGVKIQLLDFSRNPFDVNLNIKSNKILCNAIPSINLETLGAMKIYATMYRTKRKDAVDLYFIIKNLNINIGELIEKTQKIFGKLYQPIASYENILTGDRDMGEKVNYLIDAPSDKTIINFLQQEITKYFSSKV